MNRVFSWENEKNIVIWALGYCKGSTIITIKLNAAEMRSVEVVWEADEKILQNYNETYYIISLQKDHKRTMGGLVNVYGCSTIKLYSHIYLNVTLDCVRHLTP